jgi:GDP-D-mannose 3',5'-epimerase
MLMIWKNKKVLVAGGAGAVGSQVAHELVALDSVVTIADNFSSGSRTRIDGLKNKASINIADLRDERNCMRETKNKDIVIQLAANTGGSTHQNEANACIMRDNFLINVNMLHASHRNKVRVYYYCVSYYMYPAELNQYYGVEKLAIEKLCKTYQDNYGMDVRIVHFQDIDDCITKVIGGKL